MRNAEREDRDVAPSILFADSPTGSPHGKTIEDLCAEHLGRMRNRVERRLAKPRTLADLERLYRVHILPAFAGQPLTALDGATVERWHSELSRKAPVQANRAAQVLRAAWKLAERFRWVEPNSSPLEWVEWNREEPRTRVLTEAERGRMLEYLEACESRHWRDRMAARAILLLYLTGARKTEIFGLTWGEVHLTETPPELRLRDSKTGPKSIALTDAAVALLRKIRKSARSESGPVFPQLDYKRLFYPMRKAIGAPDITLHDLRRTFCSILAEAGVSAEDVAAVVGQKTVQVQIRHYRHLSPARRQALAEQANALLCERKH